MTSEKPFSARFSPFNPSAPDSSAHPILGSTPLVSRARPGGEASLGGIKSVLPCRQAVRREWSFTAERWMGGTCSFGAER